MLDIIRGAWSWTGLVPAEVVASNDLGNVIVRATDGALWRICPEELACEPVAPDAGRFEALWTSPEFQADWRMERLVEAAKSRLGPLTDDRCYCLKVPAVLGGRYEVDNVGTISRRELIAFAGDLAEQTRDLPDGAQVTIEWVP